MKLLLPCAELIATFSVVNNRLMQDRSRYFGWTVAATLLLEAVTILLRFGAKLESTRDTASVIAPFTFGFRIHHSYIGFVVFVIGLALADRRPRWGYWLTMAGLSLFFSDMVHHFVVLWFVTGSPQFDLVYPSNVVSGQG